MKQLTWRFLALFVVLALRVTYEIRAEDPVPFKVVEAEGGVSVSEGETKVLFYQLETKALDGKHARANYVHPLYDLDGHELTEDFPSDHPHHRGVFWAWHQVLVKDQEVADFWSTRDAIWQVRDKRTDVSAESATVRASVDWKSRRWTNAEGQRAAIVREETTIRVHRARPDYRYVDFEIRLLALQPEVKLGGSDDDKGYGGFSPRLRLPKDVVFLGRKGTLEPQTTAIEAGPWVDVSGTFAANRGVGGVSILGHPSLPVFPPPWILRRERSMQNAVFPGRSPVALSTKDELVLRYRLVVHRGAGTAEQVEAWQRDFSALR